MIFQNENTFPWTLSQYELITTIVGIIVIVLIILYIGFSLHETPE